jgi:hypothetical protein
MAAKMKKSKSGGAQTAQPGGQLSGQLSEQSKSAHDAHEIRPGQSIELLKELHILTRDGKMNQDSRRKLKQVYHLYQFIEPLMLAVQQHHENITLVDHGAGKSYLGFILYDLFFKAQNNHSHIYGIETRDELVSKSQELATRLGFSCTSSTDRHCDCAACLQYRDGRCNRLCLEKKGGLYRAGSVLSGRSGGDVKEKQTRVD